MENLKDIVLYALVCCLVLSLGWMIDHGFGSSIWKKLVKPEYGKPFNLFKGLKEADLEKSNHVFFKLKKTHTDLYNNLCKAEDGVSVEDVKAFIKEALKSSKEVVYIKDRRDLRSWLRWWVNYLTTKGEKWLEIDIDIDSPERSPWTINK